MRSVILSIFSLCFLFSCEHAKNNQHTMSGIPLPVAQSMHDWVNEMGNAHFDSSINMYEVDVHTGKKTEIIVHSDSSGNVIHANVKLPAVIVPDQIMKNIRFGYPNFTITDVDVDFYKDSTWLVIALEDSLNNKKELKKLILP